MRRLTNCIVLAALSALAAEANAQTTTRITTGTSGWSNPSTDKGGKTLIYTQGGTTLLDNTVKGYVMPIAVSASSPYFSPGGKVVVFTSDADPLGTNDDGNDEVFLVDVTKRLTRQITHTSNPDSSSGATTDKYGKRVVFLSNADLVAGSNSDFNDEVFLYTVSTGVFTQLTSTSAPIQNSHPRITSSGKYVAWDSDADPVGSNADGNVEIFRYSLATALTTQITNTTSGDNSRPVLSADGRFVAFESTSADLAGANADGQEEVYRVDTSSATILRITDSTDASRRPFIAGNGASILFQSDGDLVAGSNLDGSEEIFRAKIASGAATLTQITAGAAGTSSRSATCNHLGTRIYFRSDADLTGQGAGNDHIFRHIP